MDVGLKVTDTPEESSFTDIVAGDNVINIPLFQREYKWNEKNLQQFWKDIEDIVDGSKQSQFLGVVVTVRQPNAIGRPTIYDIVDGQQRLFTCYISLMAAVRVSLNNDLKDWALEVARSYLLLRPFSQYPTNTKLVPSAADRQQFKTMWDEISAHPLLRDKTSWHAIGKPTPPPSSGNQSGRLIKQYRRLQVRFQSIFDKHGHSRIEKVVEILANSLSFVSISLRDPTAAPIIFERLNARGEKITTADLVRNEIFARSAANPTEAQIIFNSDWEPFSNKFSKRVIDLETLLFPYGLSINSSTTKADLFSVLRKNWSKFDDTAAIIRDMDRFSPTVIAMEAADYSYIPDQLRENIKRLHDLGAPSSTYAFLCQLVEAVGKGDLLAPTAVAILDSLEAFLTRRALCGIEPTGLHAVFKGMWTELAKADQGVSVASFKKAIKQRTTVSWPTDEDLERAIRTGDLYNRRICRFVLAEFERAEHGETPEDGFWIEHILPATHSPHWGTLFTEEQHARLRNTFANLIPLTAEMNNNGGQNAFDKKKEAFRNSIFSTARAIAADFDQWTPETMGKRADRLSLWAAGRWPSGT